MFKSHINPGESLEFQKTISDDKGIFDNTNAGVSVEKFHQDLTNR